MALKPINFKFPPDTREQGENCPTCNVPTRRDSIPCPDGRSGCLVAHFGWVCPQCAVAYERTREKPA